MSGAKLFGLDEILGKPLIVSKDKKTLIYGIEIDNRKVDLRGYVESESRNDYFHMVETTYLPNSMHMLDGKCSCESYEFYGFPCKHMQKLRNVYIKNIKKFGGH